MKMKETKIRIRHDCDIVIHTPEDLTVEELWKIQQGLYHAVKRASRNSRKLYGDTK